MSKQRPVLLCPARKVAAREVVVDCWDKRGWVVIRVPNFWNAETIEAGANISCYGGVSFCRAISDHLGLKLVEPPLDHLCHINYRWLLRHVMIKEIGSLTEEDFPAFIKSVDHKLLPSATYCTSDRFRYRESKNLACVSVLVAEIVTFMFEVRAFVCDQEVVSIGPYSRQATSVPAEAKRFLEKFLEANSVPEVCVVDIGLLDSGSWVLVELNPVWAADPLCCDIETFVECLRKATVTLQ